MTGWTTHVLPALDLHRPCSAASASQRHGRGICISSPDRCGWEGFLTATRGYPCARERLPAILDSNWVCGFLIGISGPHWAPQNQVSPENYQGRCMSKKSNTPTVRSKAGLRLSPLLPRSPRRAGQDVSVKKSKSAKSKVPTERSCLECGSKFTPSIYAPHGLYCLACSGHKRPPATVITETRVCRSCKAEFVPTGHDAWQVQRCPSCRAKRLERVHTKKALVIKVVV